MDRLWSPWRYRYVSTASPSDACIFCTKPAANDDESTLIVYRAKLNYIILNLFPYTTGHLMIVPYEHVASLTEAQPDTLAEMMQLTVRAEKALGETYKPRGMNIGLNLGEAAGAGVAGHLHLHALPRWYGDVNFMTAVAETRVLPEDLKTTYARLKAAFAAQ
jgi:ATP adenylyltransferase